MKQHLNPEQFRAVPEAQQRALAAWMWRREMKEEADREDLRRTVMSFRHHTKLLTIGVLLEYLAECHMMPRTEQHEAYRWRVALQSWYYDDTSPDCTAPELVDALWAAVCAVLEREVGAA